MNYEKSGFTINVEICLPKIFRYEEYRKCSVLVHKAQGKVEPRGLGFKLRLKKKYINSKPRWLVVQSPYENSGIQ